MIKAILIIICISCCISTNISFATEIKHVRVIWQEDPLKKTYIAWHTKKETKPNENWLHYGHKSQKGNIKEYPIKIKAMSKIRLPFTSERFYYTELENLPPNTKLYFTITVGKSATKEMYFKLPPKQNDIAFKLLFGGDSRSNIPMRQKMNTAIKQLIEKDQEVLALVHGGDYIYNGSKWNQWLQWLDDNELIIADDGKILPVIPTRGNHEVSDRLFNRVWLTPGGTSRSNYFSSKLANLKIITLNTQTSCAGKQKRWLKKELQQMTKYVLANYHAPAWPAVKKPSCAKKHWVPLFEQARINGVFESDGHTLKRTVPIYQNKRNDQKGIIYMGEGGLGVEQRKPKHANEWYFQSPGYAKSKHHFFVLRKSSELEVEVLNKELKQLDKFTLPNYR